MLETMTNMIFYTVYTKSKSNSFEFTPSSRKSSLPFHFVLEGTVN